MSNSPNLALPYIQPAQAQKHVTHNLAIERLDALVQLRVTELDVIVPPVTPFEGQVVGVGVGATGSFENEDGKLAYYGNGGWLFIPPCNGFTAWVEKSEALYVYRNGTWQTLSDAQIDEVDGLGINTSWDANNRLSIASDATLLSHEGADHRLKVNKATPGDTASILFQTGYSGRAELGLTGDDKFSLKVSTDGKGWSAALSVDGQSGDVEIGRVRARSLIGEAVQSEPTDTTPGRLMRADWGYGPGNLLGPVSQADGRPTGSVIESGQNENGYYVRYADGTQIMTMRDVSGSKPVGANATISGVAPFPASANDVFHVLASVRSYASEAYVRFAAENLAPAATQVAGGAAWAVYSKAAINGVRLDVTVISRWF